ncbi:MAG: CPBP family intramembrane metalloprotease [Clostridiales bacterium]|nr:CPBP family intramembrane metalloprotease [Clostridiales bacterium]
MSTKKVIGGCLGVILIKIISDILAALLASGLVVLSVSMGICNLVYAVLYPILAFFMTKFFVKKILKLKLSDLGITKFSIKMKYLAVALALPIAVTAFFLLFMSGRYVSSGLVGAEKICTVLFGILYTGIAAALVEEIIFRGVIMHLLKTKINTKVAVLLPSVLFGAVHVLGTGFSLTSCILAVLAGTLVGIMFSVITLESGNVWNSAIVHCFWNIVTIGGGLVIGTSVSETSLTSYVLDSKSIMVTGGEFGIEASLIAIVAYFLVAAAVLMGMKSRKRNGTIEKN